MTLVLEAMDAYDIVTGEEPEPPPIDIDHHEWKIRAAKAKTTIHLSCSPAIQFLLKGLRSPGVMWTTLQVRLEDTGTHVGRTTIQRKFRSCRLQKDQTLIEYFTLLRDYRLQFIGTPQDISDDEMRTHIYNNLPEQYSTMIKILEHQIPLPTVEEAMDALRRDEQAASLKKEIGDEATGSALFSRRYRGRGGYGERGHYRARRNYGENKGGDRNDDKEYTCTHCKLNNHTTENCGILKRLNRKDEKLCYYCGKPDHIRPECRICQHRSEARNKVNKRNNKDSKSDTKASLTEATASLAVHGIAAGDRDLFSLPDKATHAALTSSAAASPTWVVDSGASHNMCNDRNCFISFKRLPSPIIIKLCDETTVTTTFHGLVNISQGLQLNALYTPMFRLSLLSINQLDLAGYTTTFQRGKCSIFTDSINIIANRTGDLYILRSRYALTSETGTIQSAATPSNLTNRKKKKNTLSTTELTPASTITTRLWHLRLAHLHPAAMRSLIDGISDLDAAIGLCDVCLQAKHKQKFIRTKVKRTTQPFELVHSDTCGPFSIPTKGGHLHYILFVDDYTRWTTVYLLPDKKHETCIAAYQHYQAKVDARGYNIKRFRCDNGRGEYDNRLFRMLLATRGTALEFCPPYAHHKNGVAERMIHTITEKARAMILDSQAPLEFWGEAINTAVYLHQCLPNEGLTKRDDRDGYKALYETPYEMLHSYGKPEYDKPPDDSTRIKISYKAPLHHLRRFGCYVSRLIPEKQRTDKKLGARSKACMMVGYVHDSTTL